MMCTMTSGSSMGFGEIPTNEDILGSLLFSETSSPELFDMTCSAISTPEVLEGENVFGLYDEILNQLSTSPMASSDSDMSALAHPSYMHNHQPGAMMPPHSMHGPSYHGGYASYGPPQPMSVCTVPGCYSCPPPMVSQGPCYPGCGCGMDSYSMHAAPRISRTYSVGDVDMYPKERMHRRNSLPVGYAYRPTPYSRPSRGPFTFGGNPPGSSAPSFEGLSTPSMGMGSPPIVPLGTPANHTQKKNTHYMCGNCFSVGHNRRTCPNAKQTKDRRDSKSQADSCSQSSSP